MICLTSPLQQIGNYIFRKKAKVYFPNFNIVKCSDEDTYHYDILRSALVNVDDHDDHDNVGDDDDKGGDDDELHLPKTKCRVVAKPFHHWSESAV